MPMQIALSHKEKWWVNQVNFLDKRTLLQLVLFKERNARYVFMHELC